MSTVLASPSISRSRILTAVLAIGFLSMAIPTLISLASQAWSKDEGIHGPIVLATGVWLIWRRWDDIASRAVPGSPPGAWAALGLALLLYIFGRAFDFLSLEALALIAVGGAIAYSFIGLRVLQSLWFPIFYLLFLVPMPGWFIDQITAPLKQFVSYSAETLLSSAGYAIARQGVVLYVDQYQLLVKEDRKSVV